MSRVVLLNPPAPHDYIRTGRWTRKSRGRQAWPPIWLAYAHALLEREGYECLLLDAPARGLSPYETAKIIDSFAPDHIAYYFGYSTLDRDLGYAEYLCRRHDVVLVGPWSHCVDKDVLLDYPHLTTMTYGEFEHTLLDVIENGPSDQIKGLIHQEGREVVKNPRRPLCSSSELDRIPFVSQVYARYLNLYDYRQTSLRYPFLDVLGARSCPYRCSFCLWIRAFQHMDPHRYRARSIRNVVNELWWIHHNLPYIKQVWFQDDTLPPRRMRDLSQAILDHGPPIVWGGYSRAEQSKETLTLFKESGGRTLHVGYESADQETLDLIQKDITVEQMETFAKYVYDLDLWTCAGFMIFPWQTPKIVRETVHWAKSVVRPRRFSFTQLFAYPGTPIVETLEQMKQDGRTLLTTEQMTALEREGFTEFYLKNRWWMFDTICHPSEWINVLGDARGLVPFLLGRT
ncbi:MAG: hypothetical protein JRD89_00970 [Deltaproteobacteria bacterium]|nr:hypothetical protein [Deltaproteobacteria bacterium]